MIYIIKIEVGPHEQAREFAEQLLGEIEYQVLNEKEIEGVPVTWDWNSNDN